MKETHLDKQEYDETAIRMAEKYYFPEDFFASREEMNKYKPKDLFFSIDIDNVKRKNALDNYILKNYSKLDDKNPVDAKIKKNMNSYLRRLYTEFLNRPSELLDSPFLKSQQIVDNYCPKEIIDKVKTTYRENTKNPKELYIKDRNLDNLSKEENDRLMHSLIKDIGTNNKNVQEYQREYIKKLIRQKSQVKDLNPKQVEFVAKYINYHMLNPAHSEIKNNIYICKDDKHRGGFQYGSNIYLNKDSVLTNDIPHLMQVICHETTHAIQEFEARNDGKSKRGLDCAVSKILREYFSREKNYDVYHPNYRFEEIEKDAEATRKLCCNRYINGYGI